MDKILVIASTFPASETDSVPAFVKDQIIALKTVQPETEYIVLAPHDYRSHTRSFQQRPDYKEYRFHYAWPFRLEKLAGHGILPTLRSNPLYYGLVPCLFIAEFFALWRLARREQPSLLYAHWFTPQAVAASLVSKLTGIPFVYTTHAADVAIWRKIPLIGPRVVQHISSQATAITAVSRRSMAKLEAFFTKEQWQKLKQKTAIIPMGVDTTSFASSKSSPALRKHYKFGNEKIIFFIGRLAEKKGVTYLLKAFARLDNKQLCLVIAGDGPLRAALEAEASELGIAERTRFIGFISGHEKQDYFALADIFALPSIITDDGDAEGLPVVFMEALAAGRVCIATNESGADDIIGKSKAGILLPHKDVEALQRALEQALQLSPSEHTTMQAAARQTAKQFSWPAIAKQHIDFLFNR